MYLRYHVNATVKITLSNTIWTKYKKDAHNRSFQSSLIVSYFQTKITTSHKRLFWTIHLQQSPFRVHNENSTTLPLSVTNLFALGYCVCCILSWTLVDSYFSSLWSFVSYSFFWFYRTMSMDVFITNSHPPKKMLHLFCFHGATVLVASVASFGGATVWSDNSW